MSRDLAEGLLARARDDAAAVRAVLTITGVSDAIVGFHAQQAVEKSIKAVLAANDHSFPFTHDLEGLVERCHDVGVELPELVQHDAGLLTPYAVRHRYGGEPPALVDRDSATEVTDEQLAAVNITRDTFHPEWNYTISPSTN